MSVKHLLCLCSLLLPCSAFAFYGDARPDAPDLAATGTYSVGVRTERLVHHDQLDILVTPPGQHHDRALRVELWYPASLRPGQQPGTTYTDVLGAGANDPKRPNTPFQFAPTSSAPVPMTPTAPTHRSSSLVGRCVMLSLIRRAATRW